MENLYPNEYIADSEPAQDPTGAAEPAEGSRAGEYLTDRTCPRGQTRYTWRTTDTIESVAARYGLTVAEIREANPGIVFTRLNFGDAICLPAARPFCPTGRFYQVRRGDTFSSIAAQLGVTVYELTELNPYVEPTSLQIGQTICVPAPQLPSTPSTPSTPSCPSCPVTPPSFGCPANSISIIMPMGWSYGTVLTRYGISFNALQAANPGLNIEAIPAGQRLCIPPAGSRRLCGDGLRSHVKDSGETLSSLAQRFDISVSRLLRINADLAPSDFIAGRVICAPEGT